MPELIDRIRWPIHGLPKVLFGGTFTLSDQGFAFTHRLETHALHLHEYAAKVQIGSMEFAVRPGDVTLMPAGTPFRFDVAQTGQHWSVRFGPPASPGGVRTGLDEQWVELPLHVSLGQEYHITLVQVAAMVSRWTAAWRDPLADAETSAAMLELLLKLVRLSRGARSSETRFSRVAETACATLLQHLGEPITIPWLARKVGVSQNYLAQVFRRRFGVTMQHYLIQHRIARARELIESTPIPISTIAAKMGMPNVRNFYKQFVRFVGMSPSELRRLAQQSRVIDSREQRPIRRRT